MIDYKHRRDWLIKVMSSALYPNYPINQKIEVKNLIRYDGSGEKITINGVGIIRGITSVGVDIGYVVDFDIPLTHHSPFGGKWSSDTNKFVILRDKEAENIIKIGF